MNEKPHNLQNSIIEFKMRKLSYYLYCSDKIYKLIDYSFYTQLGCIALMTIFVITNQLLLWLLVFVFLIVAMGVIEYKKKQLRKRRDRMLSKVFGN